MNWWAELPWYFLGQVFLALVWIIYLYLNKSFVLFTWNIWKIIRVRGDTDGGVSLIALPLFFSGELRTENKVQERITSTRPVVGQTSNREKSPPINKQTTFTSHSTIQTTFQTSPEEPFKLSLFQRKYISSRKKLSREHSLDLEVLVIPSINI